jgi:hypothetical protein
MSLVRNIADDMNLSVFLGDNLRKLSELNVYSILYPYAVADKLL